MLRVNLALVCILCPYLYRFPYHLPCETDGLITLVLPGTGTETWTNGVVWFYVEFFTLYLNKDKNKNLLRPIVLVPFPIPAM